VTDPAGGGAGPPESEHDPSHPHHHPRLEALEAAAIEAELETGVHEDTIEEAKRHILWRMVRISIGALVTAGGIALLALPGPGLVVVALGLGILAQDVPFARRLLDRVEDRIPRDENGNLPTSAKALLALSVMLAVVGTGLSLWWTFLR
jgi:hypothetical protein